MSRLLGPKTILHRAFGPFRAVGLGMATIVLRTSTLKVAAVSAAFGVFLLRLGQQKEKSATDGTAPADVAPSGMAEIEGFLPSARLTPKVQDAE